MPFAVDEGGACGGVSDVHLVGACSGILNALSIGQAATTQGILQFMGMASLILCADPCSCTAAETAIPLVATFGLPMSVVMFGSASEPPMADLVGLAQLLGRALTLEGQ